MSGEAYGHHSDPAIFATGQRIDRYEIREHVGQGGMGAVYRAVDTKLGRTVALKTVIAHRRVDKPSEAVRQRFMREALAASKVDHRNVVQVLDFGFAEDCTPFMVMEFLRGKSLSAVLKETATPLAVDYVADVMLSVCAALRACHHAGVIHRDLKPANIFLCDIDTGWDVKVLDFGISKLPVVDHLTQDGQILGTPQYLSPEQVSGSVGPESDQYALGVLLYACLTQKLPYGDYQNVRLLRAIQQGRFEPPRKLRPELPERLEAIVLRAMHVAPPRRFASIHSLGQSLWDFASPRGQAQWKNFYFHTPASGTAVREAMHEAPALPATASLRAPAGMSHSAIAGEIAVGAAGNTGNTISLKRTRRIARLRLAVAFAAAAVIIVISVQRGWLRSETTAPKQAAGATTLAAPLRAPAAAPAASPPPAPIPPPAPPSTPAPTGTLAPASPPPPRGKRAIRHATRRGKRPTIDQQGIGIPAD